MAETRAPWANNSGRFDAESGMFKRSVHLSLAGKQGSREANVGAAWCATVPRCHLCSWWEFLGLPWLFGCAHQRPGGCRAERTVLEDARLQERQMKSGEWRGRWPGLAGPGPLGPPALASVTSSGSTGSTGMPSTYLLIMYLQ
jgi:hypothetical protein